MIDHEPVFYITRREIKLGGKTFIYQPGAVKNVAAAQKVQEVYDLLQAGKQEEAIRAQVEAVRIWIPDVTERDLEGHTLVGLQVLVTRFTLEGMGQSAEQADEVAKKAFSRAVTQNPALAEALSLKSPIAPLSGSESTSSPEGTRKTG